MITRRHLLGTAGAGAALAVSGLSPKFSGAEAAGANLTPGLPEGLSTVATMDALPLAKQDLIDHEYIAVGPLMPLRLLMTKP